jgi:nitrogen regulatory protein PII
MKKIDTLIHPALWDEARAALETLGARITLREVKSFGRTPPKREVYRGSVYFLDVAAELELTVLIEDEQVASAIAALQAICGNGEILVSSVERAVRFGEPAREAAAHGASPTTASSVLAYAAAHA